MATPPFLPDELKPGASDLISLFPGVEQTFRDVIETWLLVQHNTTGTHKQVTLDDISEPSIAADLVGLWHESGVLKTRFASGTVYDVLTTNTGMPLAGGTMTGDLVLAGAPDADLKAATKVYVDDADALKANLASPALTGNPTAPTASAGDSDTSIATTAFVSAALLVRGTAIATTSGTSKTFGSLPAGINRITLMLVKVSTNGSDPLLVRFGDAGGIEPTGYVSSVHTGSAGASSTTGFIIQRGTSDAREYSGTIVFTREDGNVWTYSGTIFNDGNNDTESSAGTKTLSDELTQIQLLPDGSNVFDNGSINIFTE